MKRLATMAGLIAAGTVLFSAVDGDVQDAIDPAILVYITAVYTLGVAVMLVYTRRWSVIGAGLAATMTGDALLYARLSHLPLPAGPWARGKPRNVRGSRTRSTCSPRCSADSSRR